MSLAAVLAALAVPASAGDGRYLIDDAVLDQVTAGTQSDVRELAEFAFVRSAGEGRRVRGYGTLALVETTRDYTLMLGDGAQQNLRSLININAIDAQVTVLLNLTINVDSVVDTLNQHNLSVRTFDALPPGN